MAATVKGTALILGATGGIGGELARQLLVDGWAVKGLRRVAKAAATSDEGVEWIRGDALQREQVVAAARGADVIVHAVNPPGYRNWAQRVMPMIGNTVAAAESVGATVVLPGTVYNFGPDAFPRLTEDSPQHPVTVKGRIRVQLEEALRAYTSRGGRVLVVRAGDFFGPKAGNSWFAQGLVKPGKPVSTVYRPSTPGVGHEWSYLPDVAQTMVQLLNRRETLEPFARFHMAGHWDATGREMVEAIARVVQRRQGRAPAIRGFPWWMLTLGAPFNETFREMREMRYLWTQPVQMDGARLQRTLGSEPHTPLEAAIEATLQGLGCLPGA